MILRGVGWESFIEDFSGWLHFKTQWTS